MTQLLPYSLVSHTDIISAIGPNSAKHSCMCANPTQRGLLSAEWGSADITKLNGEKPHSQGFHIQPETYQLCTQTSACIFQDTVPASLLKLLWTMGMQYPPTNEPSCLCSTFSFTLSPFLLVRCICFTGCSRHPALMPSESCLLQAQDHT